MLTADVAEHGQRQEAETEPMSSTQVAENGHLEPSLLGCVTAKSWNQQWSQDSNPELQCWVQVPRDILTVGLNACPQAVMT